MFYCWYKDLLRIGGFADVDLIFFDPYWDEYDTPYYWRWSQGRVE